MWQGDGYNAPAGISRAKAGQYDQRRPERSPWGVCLGSVTSSQVTYMDKTLEGWVGSHVAQFYRTEILSQREILKLEGVGKVLHK